MSGTITNTPTLLSGVLRAAVRQRGFLVWCMAFGFVCVHSYSLITWTLDDAYITFRYAENWVKGTGIVYNPGEYVEGYTNFLWLSLLALGKWVGLEPEPLSKALGLGCSAATVWLLAHAQVFVPNIPPAASLSAPLFLAFSGIFSTWTQAGMEVPLVAFLITLSVLLYAKAQQKNTPTSYFGVGLVCALAAMSRPDAGLVWITLVLYTAFQRRRCGLLPVVFLCLGFSVLFAPYFAWRFWYYGHLLPNTFYTKVGSTYAQVLRGWKYTQDFLFTLFPVLAPFAFLALVGPTAQGAPFAVPWIAMLAAYCVYVTAVGGDVMTAFRFYVPILPVAALGTATTFALFVRSRLRLACITAAFMIWGAYFAFTSEDCYKRPLTDGVASVGKVVGLWLKQYAPADALLATNTAGSIPYFSGLRTVDMLGLNDEHIAHRNMPNMGKGHAGHEKGDGKYVLSLRPHYIQFGSASGKESPSFVGDREIFASKEFWRDYELRTYRLPKNIRLRLYERKDLPPIHAPSLVK